MFTGLPAKPTSLARWFLVDETREMLDFPVDIIKIGRVSSVRDGLANDSHGPSTPGRTSASAYIGLCRYRRVGGGGGATRGGISCIQNGSRKESVGVEWSRTAWNAGSQMLGRAAKEPAGIVKFYRFDGKLPSPRSVPCNRLRSSFFF